MIQARIEQEIHNFDVKSPFNQFYAIVHNF